MNQKQQKPLNKRAMSVYLLLAIGVTWLCWIPALLWSNQSGYPLPTVSTLATGTPFTFVNQEHRFYSLLFSFAVYGPLLGGLVAITIAEGKGGLHRLFNKMLHWRVEGKWYGTAVLLILIIVSLPLLVGTLTGMVTLRQGGLPAIGLPFLILFIFQIFTSGLGEEPGWRGFLLPTLQASYAPTKAVWIMGIIWAVWHYPFTVYVTLASIDPALEVPMAAIIIPALIGQTMSLIGMAYLYTWLLNRSQSILLLIIFHALSNVIPEMVSRVIEPNQVVFLLTAIMPWLIVVILEKRLGKEQFLGLAQESAS